MATRRTSFALLLAAALVAVLVARVDADEAPSQPDLCSGDHGDYALQVDPTQVSIDLGYAGTNVHVRADLPESEPVAVIMEGAHETSRLRRKGRVWGFLWMGVGDVEFDDVPTVYLVSASAPLAELVPREARVRFDLGYDALASRAGGDRSLFGELVKLKEAGGLFSIDEGGVHLEPMDSGGVRMTASLPLSPHVPPGEYQVRLIGFEDGEARCLASATVSLEHGGLVRLLRDLAFEHGLLYGCIAVLVALLAGIVTGLVFGKGASHGH